MRMAWLAIGCAVTGCGRHRTRDYLGYAWNDRRVLCSANIDDTLGDVLDTTFVERELAAARDGGWAVLLHAHEPSATISLPWLDRMLDLADRDDLITYTYRDLVPGIRAPGLALAFDDDTPDAWLGAREILRRHHARVTFFVSGTLTTRDRAALATLAADGNDIEPHSLRHANAIDYVAAHGITAYIDDEVLPSIRAFTDAGYPYPVAYAYPGGWHSPEIDAAVLVHVDKVRTTRSQCPWR